MFTIIDINKIKQESCENEFNSEPITTEYCKVENTNEGETKHRQKPEVVEGILANIKNNKAQEENIIKEEVVPKLLDDEIKVEFVDAIVKEETEDNYDTIDVKSELYVDAFLNGTDNDEESTHKFNPKSTDKESHECNEWHKSFKCSTHLTRIGAKPYESDVCHHQSTFVSDKLTNYNCDVCDKKLIYESGEKPFKCSICEKAFRLKNYLVEHIRIHTGEKSFKCDICDKTFNHSGNLMKHKRRHTGEKPFKCSICEKAFSLKNHLVGHIRIHTGEKCFKCDICDKTFNHSGNLMRHKRSHTGDKPFKCDVCDIAVNDRSNLVRHKLSHTGIKRYKCEVCDRAFNRKLSLVRHKCCHTGENP